MTIVLSLVGLNGGLTYGLKNNPDVAGEIHFDSHGKLPNGSISVTQTIFSIEAWAG